MRSRASTSNDADWIFLPLWVPKKRRSCSLVRPCHAGCFECSERCQVTLGVDDPFHGGGTEGADQLVLEVRHAYVETESFHLGASEVGADAGPLEAASEVAFLGGVTQTRQSDVGPVRAEQVQEASDVLRAPIGTMATPSS